MEQEDRGKDRGHVLIPFISERYEDMSPVLLDLALGRLWLNRASRPT